MSDDSESNASLRAISISLFSFVNFVLWGIAAAMYSGGLSARGRGVRSSFLVAILEFVTNAIGRIPDLFAVISFTISERFWYVIICIVVEVVLVLFLIWMKRVDNDLKAGNPFRRR